MVKVNLYKIIKELGRNQNFKEKLRAVFRTLAPDIDITRDNAFDTFKDGMQTYRDHVILVPDDCVEVKEK